MPVLVFLQAALQLGLTLAQQIDRAVADDILDRLVHNAHRIAMRGDSMRKNRSK